MRYFDGKPPEVMTFGSAWQGANFELIDKTTEIVPEITLIALVSDAPGTRELKELHSAINTPDGVVLVVGCSHPGLDKIVEAAATINPKIHLIAGGFHLVVASDDAISKSSQFQGYFQSGQHRARPLYWRADVCCIKAGLWRSLHLCWRGTSLATGSGAGVSKTRRSTGTRYRGSRQLSQAGCARRPVRTRYVAEEACQYRN